MLQSSWAWDLALFHDRARWTRSRISQLEAANVRAAAQQTADSLLLQFQRQGRRGCGSPDFRRVRADRIL